MTAQHDKPKRWRPRFSVRTLVIVVTLVCCYTACWGPTKRQGVQDIEKLLQTTDEVLLGVPNPSAAMLPLIVSSEVLQIKPTTEFKRYYYFWFFGYVAKLPYERELPKGNPQPLDEMIRKLKEEVSYGGWEYHYEDTGEMLVWPYEIETSPQD